MKQDFQILTEKHLNQVLALAETSLAEAWSFQDYQKILVHAHKDHLGVFQGSVLVGAVLALSLQQQTDLIAVMVMSSLRGKGIGGLLLSEFICRTSSENIFLEVDLNNVPAVRLYLKAGFEVLGIRKKYYDGKRDAWSMKWSKPSSLLSKSES